MTIDKLLDKTKEYLSKDENKIIKRAYDFAKKAHQGKKRLSGEQFISHPVIVAYYLSQDKLDAPTIIAALFHDISEDTNINNQIIKSKFGSEIANLVDGVTKLGKIRLKKQWFYKAEIIRRITGEEKRIFAQQVDNLRKMLLAMTKDVRVILIKLADRLHNMQTLKYQPKNKRLRIAQETLEIYAPIAYRLGIGVLQGTLEDLAFPYVYPKEYKKVKKIVGNQYEEKEKYIDELKNSIYKELKKNKIKCEEINGRRKHLYSLWRKLIRYNYDISKIYDLVALRVIVKNIENCYKALGIIHKKFRPLIGRIKDYIAVAKPNGYQSLHTTIFGPQAQIAEIQIRTIKMHEQSEFGVAAQWHYIDNKHTLNYYLKEKHQSTSAKLQIDWLKELARWQEKISNPQEWSDGLQMDFFHDQIFVFTPRGDVHNLPVGATPIDFAYSIHGGLGDICHGARVNGKVVKLNKPLENGQIVEIIKDNKSRGPKKDWLRFVKSHRARDRIKEYFEMK